MGAIRRNETITCARLLRVGPHARGPHRATRDARFVDQFQTVGTRLAHGDDSSDRACQSWVSSRLPAARSGDPPESVWAIERLVACRVGPDQAKYRPWTSTPCPGSREGEACPERISTIRATDSTPAKASSASALRAERRCWRESAKATAERANLRASSLVEPGKAAAAYASNIRFAPVGLGATPSEGRRVLAGLIHCLS